MILDDTVFVCNQSNINERPPKYFCGKHFATQKEKLQDIDGLHLVRVASDAGSRVSAKVRVSLNAGGRVRRGADLTRTR